MKLPSLSTSPSRPLNLSQKLKQLAFRTAALASLGVPVSGIVLHSRPGYAQVPPTGTDTYEALPVEEPLKYVDTEDTSSHEGGGFMLPIFLTGGASEELLPMSRGFVPL